MTGDGSGTNTGQFFETLNMASIWSPPLVVVVENNGYGISGPGRRGDGSAGHPARGAAFGIWNVQVDGADVGDAGGVAEAAAFAGSGRPSLRWSCHRYNGHYEGDPDHYRTAEAKQRMRASPTRSRSLVAACGDGATVDHLDDLEQRLVAERAGVRWSRRAVPTPHRPVSPSTHGPGLTEEAAA